MLLLHRIYQGLRLWCGTIICLGGYMALMVGLVGNPSIVSGWFLGWSLIVAHAVTFVTLFRVWAVG